MDLKEMLIKEGIVKIKKQDEEPFILKSGKKSRLFIDIKQASLNPKILNEIVTKLRSMTAILSNTKSLEFNILGSVAIGGIPIATALSLNYLHDLYWYVPQIIVRTEKHDRGTQSQVIGNCKDKKVLLIEDVATTGGSIVSAVKAIRDVGGICDTCIVVVDRQEGAIELCKQNNITLYSLLKKSDFEIKFEK